MYLNRVHPPFLRGGESLFSKLDDSKRAVSKIPKYQKIRFRLCLEYEYQNDR